MLFLFTREEIIELMSKIYFRFLNTLPFDDDLYMGGMREGRTKFLSNLSTEIIRKSFDSSKQDWRYTSDYVSQRALDMLKLGKWEKGSLIFEHIVPKTKHIRDVCEKEAQKFFLKQDNNFTEQYIFNCLNDCYWTATIHKDENAKLSKNSMPIGWKAGDDILARYRDTQNTEKLIIDLVPHDRTYCLPMSSLRVK